MNRWHIPRRTFLRGAGAALALPFLDAMTPAFAQQARPTRLMFMFVPNGKHMADWTPTAQGFGFDLPYLLEPLAPHREHLLVLSGLGLDAARAHGDGPGDHARSSATFLTGAHPTKTSGADIRAGVSVDQVAARRIGGRTRFPSLELGCERGRQAGRCDSGYSCAYVSNISWRTPQAPQGKEVNPRLVFERLFVDDERRLSPEERLRRRQQRASVLDLVMGDAKRLSDRLGLSDRRKVDEYMTGVRELERRLDEAEKNPVPKTELKVPAGVPRDYAQHIRLMHDLTVLAFQTDQTRIATLMLANGGSNKSYRQVGVPGGHHHLSHHKGDETKQQQIRTINRFHTEQLADLLERFKSVREGDGTLLDNSLIVYGSAIADGNRHDHHDLPILLMGKGGGRVTPNRHVRYPRRTPLCNLYVSLLDAAGVSVQSFGDSTGPLAKLTSDETPKTKPKTTKPKTKTKPKWL